MGDIKLEIDEVAYSQEEAVDKEIDFDENDSSEIEEEKLNFHKNYTTVEKNQDTFFMEVEEIKDDKSYSNR